MSTDYKGLCKHYKEFFTNDEIIHEKDLSNDFEKFFRFAERAFFDVEFLKSLGHSGRVNLFIALRQMECYENMMGMLWLAEAARMIQVHFPGEQYHTWEITTMTYEGLLRKFYYSFMAEAKYWPDSSCTEIRPAQKDAFPYLDLGSFGQGPLEWDAYLERIGTLEHIYDTDHAIPHEDMIEFMAKGDIGMEWFFKVQGDFTIPGESILSSYIVCFYLTEISQCLIHVLAEHGDFQVIASLVGRMSFYRIFLEQRMDWMTRGSKVKTETKITWIYSDALPFVIQTGLDKYRRLVQCGDSVMMHSNEEEEDGDEGSPQYSPSSHSNPDQQNQ